MSLDFRRVSTASTQVSICEISDPTARKAKEQAFMPGLRDIAVFALLVSSVLRPTIMISGDERGTKKIDRLRACAEYLEIPHLDIVSKAISDGFGEYDIAASLLWRCLLHIELLRGNHIELADIRPMLDSLIAV